MHPIAFKLGTFDLHWFGVLVACGFLAGLWTASRRGARYGLTPDQVGDSGAWLIIGAMLGARGLYVATYWEAFEGKPWWEVFMIQKGGIVYYGGFAGASLATILYCHFRRVPLWKLADALAPSIALGSAFGRIGCFMNGCCYGRECSLPWAVRYPIGHDTYRDGGTALTVHPAQIYDSLLNLALYVLLAWLYRRKKFDGQIFAAYLICYAFARSFVEYFRGDYDAAHRHAGFFTPAQLVSIGILAAGIILFLMRQRNKTEARAR